MLCKRVLMQVLAVAVVAGTIWWTYSVQGDNAVAPPKGGIVNGTIIEKGDGWIAVRNQAGKEYRFLPRREGAGVVTDQPMSAVFDQLTIGQAVKVVWTMQDQMRVLAVTRADEEETAPEAAAGESQPTYAGQSAQEQERSIVAASDYRDPYGWWRRGDNGRIFGPVTQKSQEWIEVTPQDELPIRFLIPAGGELGDIVAQQVRNTLVGEKIEVKFAFDQGQIMALNIVRAQ